MRDVGCRGIRARANSFPRTARTAQIFVRGAFPECSDLQVELDTEIGRMSPLFNPIVTDGSTGFREVAVKKMQALVASPEMASAMPVIARHVPCLGAMSNTFSVVSGQEPKVDGQLAVAKGVVDEFILEYYDGFSEEQRPWSGWKWDEWKKAALFKEMYQKALFTVPCVARNVAAPLLEYVAQVFTSWPWPVTLLVGHDSNIAALLAAIGVKEYELPGQLENTPIGGVVVVELWQKGNSDTRVLLEYLYNTATQIREADLGAKKKLHCRKLHLERCDSCQVGDFRSILENTRPEDACR